MNWDAFIGGFFGSIVGTLVTVFLIIAFDHFTKRVNIIEKNSPDDIREKYMQQFVVDNFVSLCPGWQIYDSSSEEEKLDEDHIIPSGIQFRVKRGRIDILCIDPTGNLVVLELKKGKAPDRVVSQTERYITHVKKNVAAPNQRVKGIIIAGSFDSQMKDILENHRDISVWVFDWNPKLNKRPQLN